MVSWHRYILVSKLRHGLGGCEGIQLVHRCPCRACRIAHPCDALQCSRCMLHWWSIDDSHQTPVTYAALSTVSRSMGSGHAKKDAWRAPLSCVLLLALLLVAWFVTSPHSGKGVRQVHLPGGVNQLQGSVPLTLAALTPSGIPFCTRREAEEQAAKFKQALSANGLYAACPDHRWLSMLPGLCHSCGEADASCFALGGPRSPGCSVLQPRKP